MEKYFCGIHKLNIIIYSPEEEHQFIDDNKKEVAIFYDNDGTKYLKRFVVGQCDNNCPTIQDLLK